MRYDQYKLSIYTLYASNTVEHKNLHKYINCNFPDLSLQNVASYSYVLGDGRFCTLYAYVYMIWLPLKMSNP